MDLNFHYYAVKTLAVRAGFPEREGQIIANYSQFVDDFTIYNKIRLSEVPEFARHLATKHKSEWLFSPVTTGFDSWFEMARLIKEENQKYITVPFHFIPPHTKLNEKKKGDERIVWRVIPAQMDSESLIRSLMLDAQNRFKANPRAPENLIRIGLLIHIFADTYAHQNFSGFWGWENYCQLTKCIDIKTHEDVTKDYDPATYHQLPAIGHTEANHAPDDSNLYFEMSLQFKEKGKYDFLYSRSNVSEFCKAAKEIINYLRDCLELTPIPESDWESLSPQLGLGFQTKEKVPALLNRHWKKLFPNIDYHYDKNEMMEAMLRKQSEADSLTEEISTMVERLSCQGIEVDPALYETKSNEFFHYNVIANEIRNFVNGKDVALEQLSILENALK